MAVHLRRSIFSVKSMVLALRISPRLSSFRDFSNSEFGLPESTAARAFSGFPASDLYQFNPHRGFAKQRRQKIREIEHEKEDEDESDDQEEVEGRGEDSITGVKTTALSQMQAAVEAFTREITKLRTGRASGGMIDHIMVDHYDAKVPLNRIAIVTVLDSATLSVTPFDPNSIKAIEKAIISSSLGLNPRADDTRVIVPIPPLSKEQLQAVVKVVAKCSEDVKQSIRRARQKALDGIRKATATTASKKKEKDKSGIPEDVARRMEDEIEELTKKFVKLVESECKAKENEIRGG